MAHLRRIQQQAEFPLPVRQAAERLTTSVTRRHDTPFTNDPARDAGLIIAHLTGHRPSGGALLSPASAVASSFASCRRTVWSRLSSLPVLISAAGSP